MAGDQKDLPREDAVCILSLNGRQGKRKKELNVEFVLQVQKEYFPSSLETEQKGLSLVSTE